MALLGLLFLGVIFVMTGVGIVLGLAAVSALLALVGLGVVSSSLLIGLRTGRSQAGIRVFLIQGCLLAAVPAGALIAWAGYEWAQVQEVPFPLVNSAALMAAGAGAVAGALAGLAVALMLAAISHRLHAWAAARWASIR